MKVYVVEEWQVLHLTESYSEELVDYFLFDNLEEALKDGDVHTNEDADFYNDIEKKGKAYKLVIKDL